MTFCAAQLRAALDAHVPAGVTGLVVALSGGADSTALLRAVAALDPGFRGLPARAVHIDHGLTAAAASFRETCAGACRELGIPLLVIAVTVDAPPGTSIEAAARDARYAALAAELRGGECLLTAHHGHDQAETLLLQALRGAGLKGMAAMPFCRPLGRGWHVRPALDVPRAGLLAQGLASAAADPMNEDVRFDRSFLRREIWPLIEQRWPGARTALGRSASHAAEAQHLLERAAAVHVSRLRDGDALSVRGLRALSAEARVSAVRFWLSAAEVEVPSTARLREALRQVLEAREDHLPVIAWDGHALRRYRQRLFLTAAQPPRLDGALDWEVLPRVPLRLGGGLGELRWTEMAGGLDPARLPRALRVRGREGGESLLPAARGRTQTVQHLCQAHGVLPWMRNALPMVCADGALIAVADLWLDARWCSPAGSPGLGVIWDHAPLIT